MRADWSSVLRALLPGRQQWTRKQRYGALPQCLRIEGVFWGRRRCCRSLPTRARVRSRPWTRCRPRHCPMWRRKSTDSDSRTFRRQPSRADAACPALRLRARHENARHRHRRRMPQLPQAHEGSAVRRRGRTGKPRLQSTGELLPAAFSSASKVGSRSP